MTNYRIPLDILNNTFSLMTANDYSNWQAEWVCILNNAEDLVDTSPLNIYAGRLSLKELHRAFSTMPHDLYEQRMYEYSQPAKLYTWQYALD